MAAKTQQPLDRFRVQYTPGDIRTAQTVLCRPGRRYLGFNIGVYTALTVLLAFTFRLGSTVQVLFVGVCALLDVILIGSGVRQRVQFSKRVRAAAARTVSYEYTVYPNRVQLRMLDGEREAELRFTAQDVQAAQRGNGLTVFQTQGTALAVHDGELASHPRFAAFLKDAPRPVPEKERRYASVLAAFVSLIAPLYIAVGLEPVCWVWSAMPLTAIGFALAHRRLGQRLTACMVCGLAGLALGAAALVYRLAG